MRDKGKKEKLSRKEKKLLKKQLKKMKKKGMVDKVVMGAIIGGAIGSVVGITVAPKKGSETREYLKEKGKHVYERGKVAKEKLVEEYGDDLQAFKKDAKKKSKKFWKRIFNFLFNKEKK